MLKGNKLRRNIAIICAVAVLLSALNINLFIFADDSTQYKHIMSASDISTEGDNLLENNLECKRRFMSYNAASGKMENIWETGEPSSIKDETLAAWHSNKESCKTADLPNDTDQKDNCWQIHVKLNRTVNNPKTFVFWAHQNEKNLVSKHYAVFMASSESELFNEANKVIEITDTTERLGDQIDLTKTGKTLTGITYVGVRFYHRGYAYNGFCSSQHIKLLGLYGEAELPESTPHKAITDAAKIDTSAENMVEGSSGDATFYGNGVNTYEYNTGKTSLYKKTTIGAWHSANQSDCKSKGYSNDITQKDSYWQIQLALPDAISNPEKFLFWAHESQNNLISKHYAVFMSSAVGDLYDETNKVIEITDATNRLADEVDLTALGKTLKNICYVGIRFYHRGYLSGGTCSMQHIELIGIYGGTKVADSGAVAIQDLSQISTTGTNYLLNCSYGGGFYANGQKTYEFSSYGANDKGVWNNLGAWHSSESDPCNTKGLPNDTDQKDYYWQLEIDIPGKLTNPEKFVFVAHNNEKTRMSGHYAVFASSSKAQLFEEDSKLIEVTSSLGRLGDEIDLTGLSSKLNGISYVGIRFYHRGYTTKLGCSMQHIYLLGMYGGTYAENTVEVRTYNSKSSYGNAQLAADIQKIGDDLILGDEPYTIKVNGSTPSVKYSLKKATDLSFDSHLDYGAYAGQNDGTCDIIYKLDDDPNVIMKIKKFIYRGHSDDSDWGIPYITGEYEVYAAVNYTELFDKENMIYSYDYERDGISKIQTATFKKDDVYARFVAVRIINPVTTCTDISYFYPRISEIAFLGSEATITPEEKQLISNMPISVFSSDGKGTKNDISSELSLEKYDALIDGDDSTAAEIQTSGEQLDLVVNLLKDYKLTEAVAKTASDMGYTVYASKKFSDVWSESSKLSKNAYKDSSAKVTARYVRFSFNVSAIKSLKLNGLSVIGLTNPLIKPYEHLGLSIDSNTVSTFEKPVNSTNINDINYVINSFDTAFDGDTSKESNKLVTGGEVGKSTLNILVELSGLQNVNEITMSFTPHLVRYQPTKVRVYVGETYEDIMNLKSAPIDTFTGLPENGSYYCRIKPTLARFLRFEIVDKNYNKGIVDSFGNADEDTLNKTKIAVALSEIDIVGTAVSGMADKDGALLTFKQSGIKWSLMQLDENDVPPDVYSSKLVPVATTSKQKKSLYKSPYYKIVGDKAYKIEFYDIFGNQITNLGEREISISFPVSANGKYIVGNASNASTVDFYDVLSSGSTVTVTDKYVAGMQLAVLQLTDSNDSYWKGIDITPANDNEDEKPDNKKPSDDANTPADGDDTDYVPSDDDTGDFDFDNTDFDDTDTAGTDEPSDDAKNGNVEKEARTVVTGTETKHTSVYPGIPTYLIVLVCVEGALFLAAIGAIVYFTIRGKRNKIDNILP